MQAFSIRRLAQAFKLVPVAVVSKYIFSFTQPLVGEKQRLKPESLISNKKNGFVVIRRSYSDISLSLKFIFIVEL